MTFKGSKNFTLDKGGLTTSVVVEPQTIKEVAFLLVKNLDKPYKLKSKFVWTVGTINEHTGEVQFAPSSSNDGWFCSSGRGENMDENNGCMLM